MPPSAPLLDTESATGGHGHCAGGRCTEVKCEYRALFIAGLKLTYNQCATTYTTDSNP